MDGYVIRHVMPCIPGDHTASIVRVEVQAKKVTIFNLENYDSTFPRNVWEIIPNYKT
jgi:hypothetical protein